MFSICQSDSSDSPWPIFNRLLQSHDELANLRELLDGNTTIAFVMREGEWTRGGRAILGMCSIPRGGGPMGPLLPWLLEEVLGYAPDFLVMLSADFWADANERQREILVFHEVLHAGQEVDRYGEYRFNQVSGEPILAIINHDIEEFNAVVRRYGAWSPDIAAFLEAAGSEPIQPAVVANQPVPAPPIPEPDPAPAAAAIVFEDDEF